MARRNWSEADNQYIRDNYGRMTGSEIAAYFGVTRSTISGKCDRMGLTSKGSPGRPRLAVERVSNYRHREAKVFTPPPAPAYQEPEIMPEQQLLHSRPYPDLEPGMCNWPVYVEQGVQMYCAAKTKRLPGRFAIYCDCHENIGRQPRIERQRKYKQGIWAR